MLLALFIQITTITLLKINPFLKFKFLYEYKKKIFNFIKP